MNAAVPFLVQVCGFGGSAIVGFEKLSFRLLAKLFLDSYVRLGLRIAPMFAAKKP
jgi:hypothetical protein